MGCGASTAKVATEEEDALEMTRPRADGVVPADGRTWKNTGKMTPARALTVLENRWPNMVLRFPPLDPNEPPAYKGDDWGDDVTYDWDFYHNVWTFYPFSWSEPDLLQLLARFVAEAGFVSEFSVPEDKLSAFLTKVHAQMHAQPYHNFQHIVDVTQSVYMCVATPTARAFLPATHRFAVLLAAICHDLDHPGYTNLYLKNEESELTKKYGPDGTLEKHHASLASVLLTEEETDILVNCSPEAQREVCRLVDKCILATDMSRHKAIVDDVTALMPQNYEEIVKTQSVVRRDSVKDLGSAKKKPGDLSLPASPAKGQGRNMMFQRRRSSIDRMIRTGQVEAVLLLIIKAADLSNVTRGAHANERWVSKIYKEFHRQGRAELEKQYPLSPGMGPNDSVSKGQIFFGGVICRPLFVMLASCLPEAGVFLDQLDENLERWKKVSAAEDAAKAAAEGGGAEVGKA